MLLPEQNQCPVAGDGDPEANCDGTWNMRDDEQREEDDPLMLEDFQGVFLVLSILLFLAVFWRFLEKQFPGDIPAASCRGPPPPRAHTPIRLYLPRVARTACLAISRSSARCMRA